MGLLCALLVLLLFSHEGLAHEGHQGEEHPPCPVCQVRQHTGDFITLDDPPKKLIPLMLSILPGWVPNSFSVNSLPLRKANIPRGPPAG